MLISPPPMSLVFFLLKLTWCPIWICMTAITIIIFLFYYLALIMLSWVRTEMQWAASQWWQSFAKLRPTLQEGLFQTYFQSAIYTTFTTNLNHFVYLQRWYFLPKVFGKKLIQRIFFGKKVCRKLLWKKVLGQNIWQKYFRPLGQFFLVKESSCVDGAVWYEQQ